MHTCSICVYINYATYIKNIYACCCRWRYATIHRGAKEATIDWSCLSSLSISRLIKRK